MQKQKKKMARIRLEGLVLFSKIGLKEFGKKKLGGGGCCSCRMLFWRRRC